MNSTQTQKTTDAPTAQELAFGLGNVVAFREDNGYDDSDFHALVVTQTPDGGYAFHWETTGSTRYSGGFVAYPDAPQAVRDAYAVKRAEVLDRLNAEYEVEMEKAVEVGKTVTVIKGRKVKVGTVAEVVWRGEDHYRSNQWRTAYRVGLLVDGQRVFVSEDNVRVVGHEDEELPLRDRKVDYLIASRWPYLY